MRTTVAVFLTTLALGFTLPAQDQSSATVAKPRPRAGATPPPDAPDSDTSKIPSKLSPRATKDNDATAADANYKADSNIVNVDVQVIDQKGNPIPNITRDKFRILEDNVPQTLSQYSVGEAPMTVAMVIEFSARYQAYWSSGWRDTLNASYGFVQSLKPDDYCAVIAYDLRSDILSDFTDDRRKTMDALAQLRIPGFSESNMFDALADTADRMSKIEGRKAILLIASGIDTFSKLTYDKARKSLQESGVPIYSIEIGAVARMMAEARGAADLDFVQGDNELRTFAKETGGQAFFPRFPQELPNIFQAITHSLRSQYSLSYSPNNQARDGKYRKITVQLINPDTNEILKIMENGKPIKYTIIAKQGYMGPRAVE